MEAPNSKFLGYRLWLSQELSKRKQRNPVYSLSSFSKALGISAPGLSQVISGKRPLSIKAARKIIEKCGLSPLDAQAFLASTVEAVPNKKLGTGVGNGKIEFEELELDRFEVISNWYHFAILSLASVRGNIASAAWISDQLGITERQARQAFDRLLRLGLIQKRGHGFYQSSKPLWVPTESTSRAIRRYHKDTLEKAAAVLDWDDTSVELFSSITMAVSEEKLESARSLIKKFREKLCQHLEAGLGDRVYTLSVQLFPISKRGEKQ